MATLLLDTNGVPYQAWDADGTLSASGLAVTRGISDPVITTATAATVAPGTNMVALRNSKGFKRRAITYNWTGNATLQILLGIQVGSLNYPIFGCTLPAGNVTAQQGTINSGGATQQGGSAPTLTNGSAYASIDAPSEKVNVFCFATGANAGNLTIEFDQTT